MYLCGNVARCGLTASGVYDANIDVIREMSYFIFFSFPEFALLCMLTVEWNQMYSNWVSAEIKHIHVDMSLYFLTSMFEINTLFGTLDRQIEDVCGRGWLVVQDSKRLAHERMDFIVLIVKALSQLCIWPVMDGFCVQNSTGWKQGLKLCPSPSHLCLICQGWPSSYPGVGLVHVTAVPETRSW